MFYVRRNKIVSLTSALIIFACGIHYANAQTTRYIEEEKILSFGSFLGAHKRSAILTYSDDYYNMSNLHSIMPKTPIGFFLGFATKLSPHPQTEFSVNFKIAYQQIVLDYNMVNAPVQRLTQESWYFEFPILARYKSARVKNMRMFFTGGINTALDISAKRKKDVEMLELKKYNFCLELGIGTELIREFTKLRPELRFSIGLVNILDTNSDSPYNQGIKKIRTNEISLYMNFN